MPLGTDWRVGAMVKADAILLVSCQYTQNDIGVPVSVESAVEIPAEVRPISRSEWQAAGLQGLNAAYMLVTPECNYSGQEIAILHGVRYGIYRTYTPAGSENIELYLQKKAGVTDA